MFLKTPPRPIDVIITFCMATVFQCVILAIKLSTIRMLAEDPTLEGRHFFFHALVAVFTFFISLFLFFIGAFKFFTIKKEDKIYFKKIILVDKIFIWALTPVFILEIISFLNRAL